MLTVGSLFAGIGGFDLGLERAGMRSVWQCEIDPYAIRVLEKHWPDVLRVRDVRDVGADTVPYVDVICGGFPCQDISLAGKGAGLDGARSGLWSEYARVVGELRPRYVVVENVRALVVRGLDRVLRDLAACGYDAEWDCIPASAVGAPHQRDRVWLVAYPDGQGELQQGRPEPQQRRWAGDGGHQARDMADPTSRASGKNGPDLPGERECGIPRETGERGSRGPGRGGRSSVGDADDGKRDGGSGQLGAPGWREPSEPGWWATEPDVGRVAHGIPARVDRLRGLGNALVPQVAEWIGRRILEWEGVS